MGARSELLHAARELSRKGQAPFSPAELISEARAHGSNYPDTTLRTHIVGLMCENSPDNHAVQYKDLRRVGRGLYRLADDALAGSDASSVPGVEARSPVVQSAPSDAVGATKEWWWEGNVQAVIVYHLATEGWSIHRVADTSSQERGVDIGASRGSERLLVEVKGYPSATYVGGVKQGRPKATGHALQGRHYFGGAILSGMLMRNDHPDARIVLAFPDVETYRTLALRTVWPLTQAGLELWFVTKAGTVTETTTSTDRDDA